MNTLAAAAPRTLQAWRMPLVLLAALLLLLLLGYRDTALDMVDIWWRSESFTHAFVVPPISAWLIWRRRAVLANLTPEPSLWLLAPLLALALLWSVGAAVSANVVKQFALTAMVVVAVPTMLGWRVARVVAFPLLFLFFAVPAGESLTPLLMRWTADFTVGALRLSGIPVFREGQQFVIPSGRWSVVEACSGVRYLMASTMVGTLFAYLNYRSLRRRLIFVVLAMIVPILANWVRAYLIVILGHLSDNRIATGVDHLVYGWVFFGIVIMALFFIGARWAEDDEPGLARGGEGVDSMVTVPLPVWRWTGVWVVALACVQWPVLLRLGGPPDAPASASRLVLPEQLASGWMAEPGALVDWRPTFVGAAEQQRRYAAPAGSVGVYIAHYPQQTDGQRLVSSVNMLVRSGDLRWNQLSSGKLDDAVVGHALPWRTADLLGAETGGSQPRARLRIWHLYWVGGHLTGSDVLAKLWQAQQRLTGRPDGGAAIVLYTDASRGAAADRLLGAFVADNFDKLAALLAQAQGAH